jgi:hypothetical protein
MGGSGSSVACAGRCSLDAAAPPSLVLAHGGPPAFYALTPQSLVFADAGASAWDALALLPPVRAFVPLPPPPRLGGCW